MKITKKVEKAIIEMVYNGHTMTHIMSVLGISRQAEWRHRKTHPEYAEKLEQALDIRYENVVDALYASALSGNFQAQRFWLVNRSGGKWQDSIVRLSGGEGGDGSVSIIVKSVKVNMVSDDIDVEKKSNGEEQKLIE